jgi:DNA-binding PadR family transcriptional regulator
MLVLRPWTAYDLNKQVARSIRWVWPRSERSVYGEPKRLVALGWATAETRRSGLRSSTEYRITDAGREALRTWVRTDPAPPVLEIEAMLRLVYADQGTPDDLVRSLRSTVDGLHAGAGQALAAAAREYLDTGGPFPDRLNVSALYVDFYQRFLDMIDAWTADAIAEISRWPATTDLPLTPHARSVLESIAARHPDPATEADQPT